MITIIIVCGLGDRNQGWSIERVIKHYWKIVWLMHNGKSLRIRGIFIFIDVKKFASNLQIIPSSCLCIELILAANHIQVAGQDGDGEREDL
jgi:hypothetical protein